MSRSSQNGTQPEPPRRVRCAIYTRKSTSEGLESDFNTLDAQREAAEYYIRAMRGEGWEALPDRYDDGGFTGANVERPALRQLLTDIEAGKVDCVVVYKVDRLSRSLLDFAQLLALFEEKSVGFVSTTQQFNTRDAMGRLTFNILLSFAQFEREMIADRTRDKMGAARKRGKWLGSRPPLGYEGDRDRMRLVVVPEEADRVRTIFQLYLRLRSVAKVALRLRELRWERKRVIAKAGHALGGGPWTEKDVHLVLRNPIYLGKVRFKGKLYEGEHEAIVDAALFEHVQVTLDSKACGRGKRRGRNPEYLLQGLLHCGLCDQLMTTTSAQGRKGEVYRYYACRNRARTAEHPCDHPRLTAPEVEALVVERLRHVCSDVEMRDQIATRMQTTEPDLAARIQGERAKVEQQRASLRAEADHLMRTIGRDGPGPGGKLLAERIGEIESELGPLNTRADMLDGQMHALQVAAEQVRQTMAILEVFDEAWAAFDDAERQELTHLLVERVVVNEPAGRLDITFHDLGGPLGAADAEAGGQGDDDSEDDDRPAAPQAAEASP